ncbi:MAG TPA: 50S ribosomal protein L13 [Candidatus Brocadiia bacterium]|nr:50S ribosomal protein L13 [Candidatus Brocadiia bacterium]
MKTFMAKKETVQRSWHILDATDKVLGRMAVRIATILMGKDKPTYTPHCDTGDFVIVTNAAKLRVTGNKLQDKTYRRFSGYPGGLRTLSLGQMMAKSPEAVVRLAVRRMLPKNKLANQMLGKLKVYAGAEHPHKAQQPATIEL